MVAPSFRAIISLALSFRALSSDARGRRFQFDLDESGTDARKDRPADGRSGPSINGQTNGLVEMTGRIKKVASYTI